MKKYKEIEEVLQRQDGELKAYLESYATLIEDVINFGTQMIKWDSERGHGGDENLSPILFLRNILELGDAISILIKNSSIEPCKPLLRSMLENSFGLEYMLEDDTKNRALAFMVFYTHRRLTLYEKFDTLTPKGKRIQQEIKKDKRLSKVNFFDKPELKKYRQNDEELLKLPLYIPIEKEYQKTTTKHKNASWYSLFNGPLNVDQLAKHLKANGEYEILYRSLSGNVHATSILDGKVLLNNEGTVHLVPLRNLENAAEMTLGSINILINIYDHYLKKLLPNKTKEFSEWFQEFGPLYKQLYSKS